MASSQWADQRFGDTAEALQDVVVAALAEAHGDAVAAQGASGTRKRDPYGHTMKNRQHECLVSRVRDGEVPGAEVFRPRGAPLEMVRIPATNAVLFPWRYATDAKLDREDARMRTSGFRRDLLAASTDHRGQLDLEHARVDDDELEAQLAEEDALAAQLRTFARVVTIGYASNPTGLFDLGWGDAELVDEDGTVDWAHWESLTELLSARSAGDRRQLDAATARRQVADGTESQPATPSTPRFDAVPFDADFGLQPRNPLAGEPQQEITIEPDETGSQDDPS